MKLRSHWRRSMSSETPWLLRIVAELVLGLDVGRLFIQPRSTVLSNSSAASSLSFSTCFLRGFLQLGEGVLQDHFAFDELIERLVPDFRPALRAFRLRQIAGGHQLLDRRRRGLLR